MIEIRKAKRTESYVRIGLSGPSGSGKTYSSIRIGMALADASPAAGKPGSRRVVVIDTERASADLYAHEITADGVMDYDVIPMPDFRPATFTAALHAAAKAGYDVVIIDSFSHAWESVLAWKDSMQGNSFTNWGKVTPVWDALVDTMLRYPGHVICCLRAKMDHVQVETNGKKEVQKLGMGPIVRQGMEYEFTVFGDLEHATHRLTVSKTRCSALNARTWIEPGADFARVLLDWLATADAQPAPAPEPAPAEPATELAPRWTPAEGRAFFAALKAAGIPQRYEDIAAWCESVRRPRPSAMTAQSRADLIAAIKPGGTAEGKMVDFVEGLAKGTE